jgi:hypothetical protein
MYRENIQGGSIIMSKSMKQLTLDYFSGKLVGIKNDIKNGKVDPLQPLADVLDTFQKLPDDRVIKLPEFVSLFATLCDILDYKVQAFKSLMFDVNKDKLARLFQDTTAIDDLASLVAWRDPIEFNNMSWPFVREIVEKLGMPRRIVPQCEVIDEDGGVQLQFDLPAGNQDFFEEKTAMLEALKQYDGFQGSRFVSLGAVLDYLENDQSTDRMQAFVHVLHLIQDGELILHDDDGTTPTPELQLWRDKA